MQSDKKLTTYRRDQFSGPRRRKPPVRRLNRKVKERIKAENALLQQIMQDAKTRQALWRGMADVRGPLDPILVWNDFDLHDAHQTRLAPSHLPRWNDIGEYLKTQILFMVGWTFGGSAFTARIRPDLQRRWMEDGRDPMDRVRRELDKGLRDVGLHQLEYMFVLEGKSRRGASKTGLHLHGILVHSDPLIATQLRAAMGTAFSEHRAGKLAAGYALKSGDPVRFDGLFDNGDGVGVSFGRWGSYILKNVLSGDDRIQERRIYFSREATKTIKSFWLMLREE